MIHKLNLFFDRKSRVKVGLLFLLMLISSILEAGGVGLVFPLISVASDPSLIDSNSWLKGIKDIAGIENAREFLLYMAICFFSFYILKNIIVVLMNYAQFRFVFTKRSELGSRLFAAYLNTDYAYHLDHNKAELLRNIEFSVANVFGYFQCLLRICTELCLVASMFVLLFVVNPKIVILCIVIIGGAAYIFYKLISRYVRQLGKQIQDSKTFIGRYILEGLGAIKEVKIFGREAYFPNQFFKYMLENAQANWLNSTINLLPRIFLEIIAVGAILSMITYLLSHGSNVQHFFPTLSVFALAAVRLMPSISKILSDLQAAKFQSPALDIVHQDLLKLETPEKAIDNAVTAPSDYRFEKSISIHNLWYQYPGTETWVLRNINMRIEKGESIAFTGQTGSGKTTLVNLILGLLEPTKGEILADNRNIQGELKNWQSILGYVPQAIFLLDSSVRENVAFGLMEEDINTRFVEDAVQAVGLSTFIEQLPGKYNTVIGENGVKMSGGQRQRLGIARALYNNPEIIVFDEATSSLDTKTESEVGEAIDGLAGENTLIIIAHRFSTIQKCDRIFYIENGTIVDSGTFNQLVAKNDAFRQLAKSDRHHE